MTDATYLKAHRAATCMGVKKVGCGRLTGRTKGGMNTKLHAICDSQGRPLNLFFLLARRANLFPHAPPHTERNQCRSVYTCSQGVAAHEIEPLSDLKMRKYLSNSGQNLTLPAVFEVDLV
jgi:hypothetical protein